MQITLLVVHRDGGRFHAFIHPCDVPGNSFIAKHQINSAANQIDWDMIESNNGLSLFPNPTTGQLRISLDHPEENDSAPVRIIDMTGKLIYSGTINGIYHDVDLSKHNGLFLVQVLSSKKQLTKRVVINR